MTNQGLGFRSTFICVNRRRTFLALSLAIAGALVLRAQEQPARKSHIDDLVAGARAKVARAPERAESYVELANALVRRAREKDDPAFDREAEDALLKALHLQTGNFEARKTRVIVRLHQQRFADALEEAQTLNKEIPDENIIYGLVSDAQFALGNYKEAEAAAQRMLDMRQVNGPGLQRGANIREEIGYIDGAIDWWGSSLRLTSATDEEERAYILVQLARLNREIGKHEAAAGYSRQALDLVPDYPRALTELALDRLAEGKPAEAADLLRQRLKASNNLESRYWLAEALRAAGQAADAAAAGSDFEKRALTAAREATNANPLLILFEADHGKAAEAVRIGAEAAARRHDTQTLDAYAWALYAAGDYESARRQMDLALAPGIRNSLFFYHAGMIAKKCNDFAAARKFFQKSLEVNAGSPTAPKVIEGLAAVSHSPSGLAQD